MLILWDCWRFHKASPALEILQCQKAQVQVRPVWMAQSTFLDAHTRLSSSKPNFSFPTHLSEILCHPAHHVWRGCSTGQLKSPSHWLGWEPGSLHTGQSPLVQVRVKHTGLYIWPLHFIRVLAYRTLRMVFSYWSKSYDWSPGPGQSPGWAKTWISYICMSSLHVPPHTPHRTWPGNLSWHVAYMWHWSYGMISWLRWWLRIFGWK